MTNQEERMNMDDQAGSAPAFILALLITMMFYLVMTL